MLGAAQSGFRKKYSCQTSLHGLTEYMYENLKASKVVGMVTLDLKKAFDAVDHLILLEKLKIYGIRNTTHSWFYSYINDRTQTACINGTNSVSEQIKTGVPQGSILGPLLFIVYINDIPACLENVQ